MIQASRFLTDSERNAVEEAIKDAESKTSAEVVVVLASQSGRYDRAEDFFGILLALVVVSVVWVLGQDLRQDWGDEFRLTIGMVPLLLLFLGSFIIGMWMASRIPTLARPFVPRAMMLDEMGIGAAAAFHRFRVRNTEGSTGVLIYVSLYERMVLVIGDDAVTEKLGEHSWEPVRDRIVEGFRGGRPADALYEAVQQTGAILAEPFPISADDTDELCNEIRFID